MHQDVVILPGDFVDIDLHEEQPQPKPHTHGPYSCTRCDVCGTGETCWNCGRTDLLTSRLFVPPVGLSQPWVTIQELLQPDTKTDQENECNPAS